MKICTYLQKYLRGSIFLHSLFTKVYIPIGFKSSVVLYKYDAVKVLNLIPIFCCKCHNWSIL